MLKLTKALKTPATMTVQDRTDFNSRGMKDKQLMILSLTLKKTRIGEVVQHSTAHTSSECLLATPVGQRLCLNNAAAQRVPEQSKSSS